MAEAYDLICGDIANGTYVIEIFSFLLGNSASAADRTV
jgi:hypothetical protein